MSIADLPFMYALGDGGRRSTTQMVVIHATDNTASDSAEAAYATRRPDHTSAHIYVDDDSAVRALPLDNIAFGCYPMGNLRSVQFELTGVSNHVSDATMRQAAPLVAEVCARYGIPVRRVSGAELHAGARGICGHGDVTAAWNQGDHTDPGSAFPWDRFIGYVRAASSAPVPAGRPIEDGDDMHVKLTMAGNRFEAGTSPATAGGEAFITAAAFYGDAEVRLWILPRDGSGWRHVPWTGAIGPDGTDIRDGKPHRWLGITDADAWSVQLLSVTGPDTFVSIDVQRRVG